MSSNTSQQLSIIPLPTPKYHSPEQNTNGDSIGSRTYVITTPCTVTRTIQTTVASLLKTSTDHFDRCSNQSDSNQIGSNVIVKPIPTPPEIISASPQIFKKSENIKSLLIPINNKPTTSVLPTSTTTGFVSPLSCCKEEKCKMPPSSSSSFLPEINDTVSSVKSLYSTCTSPSININPNTPVSYPSSLNAYSSLIPIKPTYSPRRSLSPCEPEELTDSLDSRKSTSPTTTSSLSSIGSLFETLTKSSSSYLRKRSLSLSSSNSSSPINNKRSKEGESKIEVVKREKSPSNISLGSLEKKEERISTCRSEKVVDLKTEGEKQYNCSVSHSCLTSKTPVTASQENTPMCVCSNNKNENGINSYHSSSASVRSANTTSSTNTNSSFNSESSSSRYSFPPSSCSSPNSQISFTPTPNDYFQVHNINYQTPSYLNPNIPYGQVLIPYPSSRGWTLTPSQAISSSLPLLNNANNNNSLTPAYVVQSNQGCLPHHQNINNHQSSCVISQNHPHIHNSNIQSFYPPCSFSSQSEGLLKASNGSNISYKITPVPTPSYIVSPSSTNNTFLLPMITLPSSTNNSTFIFEQPVAYSGNNAVHQSVTVNNNVQQIVQQMQPMTISNNGTDQFSVRNGNVQQPIYFNNNIQPVGINRTFQQSIPINHNNQCINNEAQRPVVANNHVSVPVTVNNMNNNLHHSTIINNNVSFPVFPPANSVNRPVYVNRNNTFHKENV